MDFDGKIAGKKGIYGACIERQFLLSTRVNALLILTSYTNKTQSARLSIRNFSCSKNKLRLP